MKLTNNCFRSRSDKIPLCEFVTSHVIEYKEHLQPLLLSHAHYSLALGEGSQVTYDFEGVEQQFIEQFIQSKPLILAEHLRFEYAREAYSQNVFKMVRLKVKQVSSISIQAMITRMADTSSKGQFVDRLEYILLHHCFPKSNKVCMYIYPFQNGLI